MESIWLLLTLILAKGSVFRIKVISAATIPIKPIGTKTEIKTTPAFDNPLFFLL